MEDQGQGKDAHSLVYSNFLFSSLSLQTAGSLRAEMCLRHLLLLMRNIRKAFGKSFWGELRTVFWAWF